MKFSVIIPVREINDYIRTAMPHYAAMKEQDYEILIFPDEETTEDFPEMGGRVRVIPSGRTGPAEKRDMALQYALPLLMMTPIRHLRGWKRRCRISMILPWAPWGDPR